MTTLLRLPGRHKARIREAIWNENLAAGCSPARGRQDWSPVNNSDSTAAESGFQVAA